MKIRASRPVCLALDQALVTQIDDEASRLNRSRAWVIRQALKEWAERQNLKPLSTLSR